MIAVNNMCYLGGYGTKKTSRSGFTLKFDAYKVIASVFEIMSGMNFLCNYFLTIVLEFFGYQKKHAVRKERKSEEVTWQLSKFYPLIEVLLCRIRAFYMMLEYLNFN